MVSASPGFQLFLTQRTSSQDDNQDRSFVNTIGKCRGNVEVVTLKELSEEELVVIAKEQPLFQNIGIKPGTLSSTGGGSNFDDKFEGLVEKMVACFIGLKERDKLNSAQSVSSLGFQKRSLSLRDLLKWCRRVQTTMENSGCGAPLNAEMIVLEGMDCFANHLPTKLAEKRERVHGLGHMFGLLSNHIDHIVDQRVPTLTHIPSPNTKRICAGGTFPGRVDSKIYGNLCIVGLF